MALPLWGQLEKSADDPTTIEEAIENLIDAHNDDSDAHLGSNQSLQSHKSESVIDHPAGSILADKFSQNEVFVRDNFATVDGWSDNDNAASASGYSILVQGEDGVDDEAFVKHNVPRDGMLNFLNRQSLVQYVGAVEAQLTDGLVRVGMNADELGEFYGAYFEYTDGEIAFGLSGDLSFTELGSVSMDPTVPRLYRVEYSLSQQELYFYIGGSLVHTESLSPQAATDTAGFSIFVDCGTATQTWFRMSSMLYAQSI